MVVVFPRKSTTKILCMYLQDSIGAQLFTDKFLLPQVSYRTFDSCVGC